MSANHTLIERNARFASSYSNAGLPIIPRLRSVIVACTDARVDPAHIFELEPGESVVMRNNGGRLTPPMLDEIITLALLVSAMDGDAPGPFNLVLVQHTRCGAERFADPDVQVIFRARVGIDVAPSAIHNHRESLADDVGRLRDDRRVPGHVTVSALLYDVDTGSVEEIVAPVSVGQLRSAESR